MTGSNLSTERLARLHDVMARHVDDGAAPGVVTVISRRGDAHIDVVGNSALEGGHACDPTPSFASRR